MTTLNLLTLFGGVLLLLYGMRIAGDGMQKAAGARLRGFLLAVTDNRFKGVGVGALITALLQSSSATIIMLVSFVGSGLLSLSATMGVILGADIGTTVTVQIIAFKIYDYAIALVGIGILLEFLGRKGPLQDIGQAVLGFAFIFLALKILTDVFLPLAGDPLFKEMLTNLGKDPVAGIIISALLTAIFYSSAATIGLALTLAHNNLITLDAAMPIVLGANIGTCVSAITSSIGAPADAKRVALAHVLFKAIGVVIVLPFLSSFTHLVGLSTPYLARQVANAHTFFNIAITLLFLPFISPFTRLVEILLPEKAPSQQSFGPKYLDKLVLTSPSLALGQATREALRIADIVSDMLKQSIEVFKSNNTALMEAIEERDDDVDMLDREIKLYLTKLSQEGLTAEQARREMEIITFTNNLENIGDVIDKNLMELAKKKTKKQLSFSRDGLREILEFHQKVMENFELGISAFTSGDVELAHKLLRHKMRLGEIERDLRQAHINRLHLGLKESIDTSAIHLDVLTNLQRINSYVANIAYPILEKEKGE
ncbi:MAG: Na/Pi cotransporter family protein [Deltaproteobacteria bacterium]|nr:Na/Pi cotransporter family protein [Deltaproteobacteria bacterium]